MSVTFAEIYSGRSGSQDRTWFRRYTRAFRATTDNARIGPVQIRQAFTILVGYSYNCGGSEVDSGAFVESIRVEADGQADDGKQWFVNVEYGPYDASLFPANKLDWPIRASWGSVKYERVVERDINGDPVLNSAGDPFDPPHTIDDSRPQLTVIRNEATYDPSLAGQYKDHVSSDVFLGYAAGSWKCADITGELQLDNDLGWYYQVTYTFELRNDPQSPKGWTTEVLDQGLRKLSGSTREQIVVDGAVITSPVLLDGAGGVNGVASDPVFLEFDVYPKVAFAPLALVFAGAPGQSWS